MGLVAVVGATALVSAPVAVAQPVGVPVPGAVPGTVVAWGDNGSGQSNVPDGLTDVTAVAAGYRFSMALKSDGTVVAWGDNSYGQSTVPDGLTGVTAIAAGWFHGLALRSDGTVVIWGSDKASAVPTGLTDVVAIAAGQEHYMALKSDGTVVTWGSDQLGSIPVPTGLAGVTAVAAGVFSYLALRGDGTVTGWTYSFAEPIPKGLSGVIAMAGGALGTGAAVKSDGTVTGWGYGNVVPAGLNNVTAVAGGNGHFLARKSDGRVVAWGSNSSGQSTPPAGLTGVTAVAAGAAHSLAVTAVPQLRTVSPPTASAGQPYSFTFTATNSPVFSATGLPNGLVMSSGGMVSGTVTRAGSYPVTVTATNRADATLSSSTTVTLVVQPASLARIEFDLSSALVIAGVAQPFTVQGFDSYDNSLGDQTSAASFSIAPDGNCTAATCTSTTAGPHTVTASVDTGSGPVSANSVLMVTADSASSITASGGDAQTAAAGTTFTTPLQATVADRYGNPVSGTQVTFTVSSGAAGFGDTVGATTATATTDQAGHATAPPVVAGITTGPVQVTATAAGAGSATFTVTVHGGPVSRLAVSPATASVVAGVAQPFTVQGFDSYDNSLGDLTSAASFSIAPDGSCTAATCTATTAGPHTVTATVTPTGAAAVNGSAVLTVTAAAAATVTTTGGGGQTAPPNTAFPTRLGVQVKDGYGNPVSGAAVTFTVGSGSAAFSGAATATATTDGSGVATAPTLTAGGTPGSVQITATTTGPGGPVGAVFTATVQATGPARADLTLTLVGPATVRKGGTVQQTVTITNKGPHPASNVQAAIGAGDGLPITSASTTSVGVRTQTRWGTAVITAPTLASGASITATLTLSATGRPGTRLLIGAVASGVRDPQPFNNVALTPVVTTAR